MSAKVLFLGLHLVLSGAVEALFSWKFGHNPRAVVTHVLLLAEWDLALLAASAILPRFGLRMLLAVTCTLQAYLYTLDAISNASWGRNITGHLVAAFAPTIWSGKEAFPVGAGGIVLFLGGIFALILIAFGILGGGLERKAWERGSVGAWERGTAAAMAMVFAALFVGTLRWGTRDRDNLFWTHELLSSFCRPDGYAFEPSARRYAVADRDARLEAAYPRNVAGSHRKNVILIIVDSLRADRMQVYGYPRETTPYLSQLVQSGCMKKVQDAFSTCSESFCGITSTLASREFPDISARTFQLQDVLRDEGYHTWFLLSGNHNAWNGLPAFYHASPGTMFDGTQTQRYTVDDDRLVLEGLERVPPASPQQPAFFYVHLMSTHYLGVQLPESHVFTRPDDRVSPGVEPYKILSQLNKPDRYDDKVRQADSIIHQLLDAFSAKHYLEDAIVVITGDHGEGLGERHWAHGWNLYNEDIRVPMLFYETPAASYPDLKFGVQVDIAPTILDRLGLPIPSSWEGQSLLRATSTRYTYHQTYFFPNRYGVIYRTKDALFKFIATPRYGTEELYDLERDRRESANLVLQQPALAADLREKVRQYLGQ